MHSVVTASGLQSVRGEKCGCRSGLNVCSEQLVCCTRCWERIERIRAALAERDILDAVVGAAGGPLSFAFGLSRKRGRGAMMARHRIIRAVHDRLVPAGASCAQVRLLLGVSQESFALALDV